MPKIFSGFQAGACDMLTMRRGTQYRHNTFQPAIVLIEETRYNVWEAFRKRHGPGAKTRSLQNVSLSWGHAVTRPMPWCITEHEIVCRPWHAGSCGADTAKWRPSNIVWGRARF